MVCYSADGKSGFLTKQGIADIKSMLAKEIFQQDLVAIYQRQTQRRDELTKDVGEIMARLVNEMQYGYLPPPVESSVDEVVNELEKDPRIAAAYDLWYQLRDPLVRQREFKTDQKYRGRGSGAAG